MRTLRPVSTACTTICPVCIVRRFVANLGVEEYRRQEGISQGSPAADPQGRHAGEWTDRLAKNPAWFKGSLGRENTRKIVALAQAEQGEGPLFEDLVPEQHRRDEYRRHVTALLDAIHRRDTSITRAYDDAMREREKKYLTPEARAALKAEREAKARQKALSQHADYLLALTNIMKHPGPGDDVPIDKALDIEEASFRVLSRITDQLVADPMTNWTLANLRVFATMIIDSLSGSPTDQGNGTAASSPNGRGTLALPAEAGEAP